MTAQILVFLLVSLCGVEKGRVLEDRSKVLSVSADLAIASCAGVGSDLVCMGEQPLHAVPLFKVSPQSHGPTVCASDLECLSFLSFCLFFICLYFVLLLIKENHA